MRPARSILVVVVSMAVFAGVTPSIAVAATFRVGFFDSVYTLGDDAIRDEWFQRTTGLGGSVIRVMPQWSDIAPARPTSSFHASDPADPQYRWGPLDVAVKSATQHGVALLFTISGAPRWAQGPQRPSGAEGAWRPDPKALSSFATAAAKRYSGTFPDPAAPDTVLPRIRNWQIWNEPNLETNLAPQWVRKGHGYAAASPGIYRSLLNAGYRAIKAVGKSNFVVTAGTAPYGDLLPGGGRIAPVDFDRRVLCLGRTLRRVCHAQVHFDAISHHPYAIAGPHRHALNTDDVAVPDLAKLKRVLRAARRLGVTPGGSKQFWVTELSWDSNPPDPEGVPARRHAAWLEDAFYLLWRQGVSTVTWFQILDQPKGRGYPYGNQSGMYLLNGDPKVSATAFRFPFVVERHPNSRATVWGMAPAAHAAVTVERRLGRTWKAIDRAQSGADRVFHFAVRARRGQQWRATAGSTISLTWTVA